MYKLPLIAFKVLGFTVLFILLLDTSLVVIDTVTVYNNTATKIEAVLAEVSNHNCVPVEAEKMFKNQLEQVVSQSDVATGVVTNMKVDVVRNGKTYKSLSPDNAGEYGDILVLYVEITCDPMQVYLNTDSEERGREGLLTKGKRGAYTLKFEKDASCLRYLK